MTRRTDDGHIERMCPYLYDQSKADCVGCPQRSKCNDLFFKTLARYEDTDLPPDVCEEYKKFEDNLLATGYSFNKVLEILDIYKAGTVKPLPCDIGGVLYRVQETKLPKSCRLSFSVRQIHLTDVNFYKIVYQEFGDLVFDSREEADKRCLELRRKYEANLVQH